MVNRRHIRSKVLQAIYAMTQNQSDQLDVYEKYLFNSLENIRELYLLMLSSLIELQKVENDFLEVSAQKHLATPQEKNPNKKFVNNLALQILSNSETLNNWLDELHINQFHVNDQYIKTLLQEIKASELYKHYMRNGVNDFKEDKEFLIKLFTDFIAPNEKIYEFLEDYRISWIDDIPVVNTAILKQLEGLKDENTYFKLNKVFKDDEDKEFAKQLFRKTALNADVFVKEYEDKTRNWELDRIAEIDSIILNLGVCELQKFPSIPVKVTINEYLELAKEYSTPKSSIFINGILDALVKEYREDNKLNKIGRGLIE
ncbi:transcription antitermination factor NusB [Paenimyroides viscosum]|uniref:Transcription antitermination factor NusB n=1 Tax=Paenimyroides viscosum TaxID=2488729 RepID=A0A3P1AXM0_9FLAO|nr:transcription antitermination factor NusB [Paenimyroides viscosum]RRA93806.1 transcription antitermination factor NusB [Paenimyroides viscosum]